MSDITAKDIIDLLAVKHSQDVFVAECKTGPSYGRACQRFDAWVLPRSYTQFRTIGYEVKVSRGDFMQDDKWQGYLPYCHEFNFVAPPGVIEPGELPEGIGLYVTSKNGTRLFRKRKAARRDIDIDISIYLYILISRCYIQGEYNTPSQTEYWVKWLEDKDASLKIGHMASKRLGELYKINVQEVRTENRMLKDRINALEYMEKVLADMGIDSARPHLMLSINNIIREAKGFDLARDAMNLASSLERLAQKINNHAADASKSQEKQQSLL